MIEIIKQVALGALTRKKAAQLSGYGLRQISRNTEEGPKRLIRGNADKPSNNKTSGEVEESIVEIMSTKLEGFDPTHATEMLKREYNITANRET